MQALRTGTGTFPTDNRSLPALAKNGDDQDAFHEIFAVSALAVPNLGALAQIIVLTVMHGSETTKLDMPALESKETREFEMTTIQTERPQTFTGFPLATFLEEPGVTEGTIKATAIRCRCAIRIRAGSSVLKFLVRHIKPTSSTRAASASLPGST